MVKEIISLQLLIICTIAFQGFVTKAQDRVVLNPKAVSCGYIRVDVGAELYAWETSPDDIARVYIDQICKTVNIEPKFIVKRGNVPTALSTRDVSNRRVIFYSLSFFQSTDNVWFKRAILAHEISHFLNDDNLNPSAKRASDELKADEFAGFVIAKLGGDITDVKKLMDIHCETQGDDYYPPKSARIEAVEIGFEKGKMEPDDPKPNPNPNAIEQINITPYFDVKVISREEFDRNEAYTKNNGMDAYEIASGYLAVARETKMAEDFFEFKQLDNYQIQTQIRFDYDDSWSNDFIDPQQYFVWDGLFVNRVVKGYYITAFKGYRYSDSKISLQCLEIGYLDGTVSTPLMKVPIDIFYKKPFLDITIRKFEGKIYLFVNGDFMGSEILNNYVPGSQICIVNNVEYKVSSNGDIRSDQLTYGGALKVNYVRLSSLKRK